MSQDSHPGPIDLMIHARWILPIVPFDSVLSDCSLVIHEGLIVALLPTTEARRKFAARREYQLDHHIVTAGLVNAHNHAGMTLLRGLADDQPLQTWLEEHIWPVEGQWVSPEFVEDGAALGAAEMIRSGTTTFSDMYFFPEETARVAREAGLRCQIAFPILDSPTAWGQGPDDYIQKGLALHDTYRSYPTIRVAFGPHAPYTVSDEPLRRIATMAEEMQACVHIHLHETAQEVEDALAATGERPLQRLHRLGLLSPLTQCVHMTQINDEDLALLAETGAHVIHCPSSNLKLASGFCPVQALLEEGINVALGTDSAASNNHQNLLAEMRTAALLAKGVSGNASAVDAHTALRMATLNGARALGLDDITGSLETGKQADIIAIAVDQLEQLPLYCPASTLVYSHSGSGVTHSWVQGQPLLLDGQLQTLNPRHLQQRAQYWQQRIGR